MVATLSTNQAGVPIVFSVTTPATHGFTASVSPTTASTVSGTSAATASATFTPSNYQGDISNVTARIGTSAVHAFSGKVSTIAGNPTTVSWTIAAAATPNFNQGSSYYLTTFGIPLVTGATTMAEFASATGLVVAMSDTYGNPILFSALTNPTIAISVSSGAGFDLGGSALTLTATCLNEAVSCSSGALGNNYYQGYAYGSTASLTAIITGKYPTATSPIVSVSSTSGNFITSTQATSYTVVASSSASPAFGAGSAIKLTATPNVGTQPGVPVTFNLCGQQTGATVCNTGETPTTTGYGGSFSSGGQIGFATSTSGSAGTATATYNIDTIAGNTGNWNATSPAPTNLAPKATISGVTAVNTGGVTTVAGPAASFKSLVYFSDQATLVKTSIVAGQNLYINVELVDAYGNLATNTGITQIQVQLSATAPTTLEATTLYIEQGQKQTLPIFGYDEWAIPASVAVGTALTLTASGVVNGVAVSPTTTLTTVSPLPTLSITSPKPTSGTIYASSTGVSFRGSANVSVGYNPTPLTGVTIASVNYKIGSASWQQASGSHSSPDSFGLSIFVPAGLSTIVFNATDSDKNTVVSTAYQLLVDTSAPTFTFSTASSNNGCVTVTAATAEGDFNTASFTATYGGVAVPAAAITWGGTQTPGTAGSLTATICGLVSQTATLSVTGSTLAGLSTTSSESLTVTVPFADSFTFNTAGATYGTVGAYKGLTVSVTNGWNTAETVVVYATFKSGTSIYVADGTTTIASGQAATVFCVDVLAIPAGSYQVTLSAVTTSNQPVSGPITPFTVTAT
ncbi:MAG: hypothetical protein ABSF83_02025 [Nitrososphaerales archaeon]